LAESPIISTSKKDETSSLECDEYALWFYGNPTSCTYMLHNGKGKVHPTTMMALKRRGGKDKAFP
jgi:hypothetical protein